MNEQEETSFKRSFRRAVEALENRDQPLVEGGPTPMQLADALDDSANNPLGRILVSAADALSHNPNAANHGHHQITQLVVGMAREKVA